MSSDYEFDTNQVEGSGLMIKLVAGASIANRDLVYVAANGRVYVTSAGAAATMPAIGMAMFAVTAGQTVRILLKGIIGLSTWTWTTGSELYASDTLGQMSHTAGTVEQQVGIAFSATQIYFDAKVAV